MTDRSCPECGKSLAGRHANARYCSRECQLDAFCRRRRGGDGPLRIILELDEVALVEPAARAEGITVDRYIVRLIEAHVAELAEAVEAGT